MARVLAPLAALLVPAGAFVAVGSSKDGHPVEGVITLLKELGETVDNEAKSEALTYQKFEYWCVNSKKTLEQTIAGEKETIDELSDKIDSYKQNIEVLADQIEDLQAELQRLATEGIEADNKRNSTAALYTEEMTAIAGTVTAMENAISALETARTTTDTGLVQSRVRKVLALIGTDISTEQRQLLEHATDPERPELQAAGDYETHVKKYSFKSNSVVELLKELKTKFENDLLATNKAETNSINAYNLAKAARADMTSAATASKEAKGGEKTEAEGNLNSTQLALSDVQGDLDADSTTLDNTMRTCRLKKSEWEERSETRDAEKAAIKAAIDILAKATGLRTEAPSNPVPPPSPVSFIQLGSPQPERAVQLLRQEAHVAHSRVIEQLAEQVASHKDGPFDQVVNMIQKMIFRLMNEQKEEDDHKNWCDKELSKTNASIVNKDEKITDLTNKIGIADSKVTVLVSDVEAANSMVANITEHMREATEIRKIGKKENALAVKDAQDAQTALANAIAVLKDFYKQSGEVPKESWEFIQRAREPVSLPETPQTWSSSYTGAADPLNQPTGIISVLERVSADFARMESDTNAQEATDQDAYNEDMKSCEIEKARRSKEAEMKLQEKKRLLDKIQSMEASRKGVKGEKEATEQYLRDLQPACVEGSSTYEERKAAREQEVQALKQAQGMLEGAFENATNSSAEPAAASASFLQMRRIR